jgi:Leucine carboxyl methyltransferase
MHAVSESLGWSIPRFDAAVTSALRDGINQVVCLAAGFDTRPYRLGQDGAKVNLAGNGAFQDLDILP